MSTAEERMQNEIDELEQENHLLRARNDRLEAELKAVPVLSAGPITSEMANWSAEDKAELIAVVTRYLTPMQEPVSRVLTHKEIADAIKRYTAAQRQWVGLTDDEYKELHLQMGSVYYYQDYGNAIEVKIKEKNS